MSTTRHIECTDHKIVEREVGEPCDISHIQMYAAVADSDLPPAIVLSIGDQDTFLCPSCAQKIAMSLIQASIDAQHMASTAMMLLKKGNSREHARQKVAAMMDAVTDLRERSSGDDLIGAMIAHIVERSEKVSSA